MKICAGRLVIFVVCPSVGKSGNRARVQYINDSKATNVNSCWYALQSMRSKVVLILGGTDRETIIRKLKIW